MIASYTVEVKAVRISEDTEEMCRKLLDESDNPELLTINSKQLNLFKCQCTDNSHGCNFLVVDSLGHARVLSESEFKSKLTPVA